MKWQAISSQSLYTRAWGEEIVVYDAQSGNTHLIGLAAGRILAAIGHTPTDAASLAQMLSDLWPGLATEQAEAQMQTMLSELAGISLITPVTP